MSFMCKVMAFQPLTDISEIVTNYFTMTSIIQGHLRKCIAELSWSLPIPLALELWMRAFPVPLKSIRTSSEDCLRILPYNLQRFRYSVVKFYKHFTSSFFANILSLKNYKAKLQLEKSCYKHFGMNKLLIKCWWNWSLMFIFDRSIFFRWKSARTRSNVFGKERPAEHP